MSARQLLAIVLLALLAAGSRWWLLRMEHAGRQSGGLPDARSEYTLDNFDLLVMDPQGLPSFQVESPHLEKTPADGSVILQQPRMVLFEDGNKTWKIDAERGWIRQDGEEVLLQGKVLMSKGRESQRIVIHTRNLKIYPQRELIEGDEQVRLRKRGTTMAGVGLKARLDLQQFELLSEVRGRYEPRRDN